MARQDSQVQWIARPVVVCLMLLISLDLLLVGLAVLGRPAHPALSQRFAADQQAAALNAQADRAREGWDRFRKRFDQRAAAAQPEPIPKGVKVGKHLGELPDEQRPGKR